MDNGFDKLPGRQINAPRSVNGSTQSNPTHPQPGRGNTHALRQKESGTGTTLTLAGTGRRWTVGRVRSSFATARRTRCPQQAADRRVSTGGSFGSRTATIQPPPQKQGTAPKPPQPSHSPPRPITGTDPTSAPNSVTRRLTMTPQTAAATENVQRAAPTPPSPAGFNSPSRDGPLNRHGSTPATTAWRWKSLKVVGLGLYRDMARPPRRRGPGPVQFLIVGPRLWAVCGGDVELHVRPPQGRPGHARYSC